MKLRYTRPALADLKYILDYIAERSPQGARNVQMRIKNVTELLLRYPRIGLPTTNPAIRRITATPYPFLIFYEVTKSDVIIHSVRHAARDPRAMPGTD